MSMFLAWVVFPLLVAAIALGCGIVVDAVSGQRLPRALVLPVGLAAVIVVAQLLTIGEATAGLATPAVVALAAAGFALALPWRRPRVGAWPAAAALGTFAVYGAPVVLSGQATFAGYIKLDDTATFLAFTDRVLDHGRSLAGLASSTYQATLAANIDYGYPIGTFLPLGIGSKLTGQDPAWLYQPCTAVYAAMLALALFVLAGSVVRSRALRAGVAFVASQAALLYGYALWGGLKELAAAALVALLASLAPLRVDDVSPARRALPFACAAAATLGVLSVTGALYVAPFLLPLVALAIARVPARRLVLSGGALLAVTALVLSIPSLLVAGDFYRYSTSNLLTASQRLGNLVRPLDLLETFGIWPAGDFRFAPSHPTLAHVLIATLLLSAAIGLAVAARRRAFGLVLYPLAALVVAVVLDHASSPWLTAKAYATASPAFVLAALVGAGAAVESGRRVEGYALAVLVAGGVLWSNVLGYHDVWLAPRSQLAELQTIGERFAGEGPALMTEYQPYGVRHFLRRLDAEGASELRVRLVPLADGRTLAKGEFADIDRFRIPDLLVYRTLVLRRSPVESRPPAPYRLVWRGRFYEVWQRGDPPRPRVLEQLALGDALHVAGVPRCTDVERLARVAAAAGGELAAVPARNPLVLPLGAATSVPSGWATDPGDPDTVVPSGGGTLRGTVAVRRAGVYDVWLGGSFKREVEIEVDGERVGARSDFLDNNGQWVPFGEARLAAGEHSVTLRYGGSELTPGSGGPSFPMGPLALSPAGGDDAVVEVAPDRARSLCGRPLDWIEAVAP